MLAAFCIRRAGEPAPPAGLRGPGGGEVRLLEEGPLGVWVAEGAVPAATVESIGAHDAVVRTALRTATPVPARYGTTFSDEQEARASLREREEELCAALERVADRVEMGLRVTWGEEAPVDPRGAVTAGEGAGGAAAPSGRAFLLARRREMEERADLRERADAVLNEVEELVGLNGYPCVRKVLPERGVAGLLAHLVHRREARSYRERVDAARRNLPGVGLHLSGPWAPYSFV
ncbi:MAG TPA: GvpL/GvpF family gas vesicle protein [Longimicrobiaceae bacterium]